MSKVYKHNEMSTVNQRMYDYTMSLASKAAKNGDNENSLKLKREAQGYLETARHHDLIGRVCGNEYVYG